MQKSQGFTCEYCGANVAVNQYIGTRNRNHCNICLWSKHVDREKGDRNSQCLSVMKPIGLTLKHEGSSRLGELMLIHLCTQCHKISINRIAADDSTDEILKVFTESQHSTPVLRKQLEDQSIVLLTEADRQEVEVQLFGK